MCITVNLCKACNKYVMKWARSMECPSDEGSGACIAAVKNGDLDLLQWVVVKRMPLS